MCNNNKIGVIVKLRNSNNSCLLIEPLWKDIYDYENGNIFKRIRVILKSLLLSKKGNANIPHDVIESLAATFLPDIRAYFESEEGKKEFEKWKAKQAEECSKTKK